MKTAISLSLTVFALGYAGCGGTIEDFVHVESGAFKATVTETGELQAVRHVVVPMPPFHWEYGQPKITSLAREGTVVHEGDVIGQVESAGVTRALGQKRTELEIARADMVQMQVQQETELKQLSAEALSAEAQQRLARIGVDRARFESSSKQEVVRLELQVAEISLEKVREKVEATRRVHVEDRRIQEAKIQQIQSAIRTAEATLERFTLRAPTEGMVEYWRNRRSGRKVGVGDQIWQGQPILGLPDLTRMKAVATVDETDRQKTYIGQPVEIRLDAFPRTSFRGRVVKISRVSRAMEQNSPIKVFDIEMQLDDNDPILKPGMTVRCELLIADLAGALFVDPSGVHRDGKEYVVYVREGPGVRRVPVTLGPRNTRGVVVQGDIKAGDRLATRPPQREM
jgi:RND family efflux transporter MFP subunit